MARPDRPPSGQALAKAASTPLHLAIAGAGVVGGAATGSWLVGAIGGLAYLALVSWDLVSAPASDAAEAPARSVLPAASRFEQPEIFQAMTAIQQARAELDRVIAEAPPQVRRYMGLALTSLADLELHAATLARRGEELSAYLATVTPQAIGDAITRLDARAKAAKDPEARGHYESARAAREEQARTLEEIATARERVLANLSRIVATVGALPSKVVKMQVLDAQAVDSASGDLNSELDRMNGEIRAFEETLANVPLTVTA